MLGRSGVSTEPLIFRKITETIKVIALSSNLYDIGHVFGG